MVAVAGPVLSEGLGRIRCLCELLVYVSRAVQHPDNVDSVGQRQKEDNVAAEGHASQIGRELRPRPTDNWLRGPERQLFVKAINPAISLSNAVVSDEVPDLQDVIFGLRPTSNASHSGGCLGGTLRACSGLEVAGAPCLARATFQSTAHFEA